MYCDVQSSRNAAMLLQLAYLLSGKVSTGKEIKPALNNLASQSYFLWHVTSYFVGYCYTCIF